MAPRRQSDSSHQKSDGSRATRPFRPAASLRPASKEWYKALEDLDLSHKDHEGPQAQSSPATMVQTRASTRQGDGETVDRPNYDVRYHSDGSLDDDSEWSSIADDTSVGDVEAGGSHDANVSADSQPEAQSGVHVDFNQAPYQPQVPSSQQVFPQQTAAPVGLNEAQHVAAPMFSAIPQYPFGFIGNTFPNLGMGNLDFGHMSANTNYASSNTVPDPRVTPVGTYYGVNPSDLEMPFDGQPSAFYSTNNRGPLFGLQNPGAANTLMGTHMSNMNNAQLGHSGISGSQASTLGLQQSGTTNMMTGRESTGTQGSLQEDTVAKRPRRRRRDTNELPSIATRNAATAHSSSGYSGRGSFESRGNFDLAKPFGAIGQHPNTAPILTNPNQLLGQKFDQPWNASLGSQPPSLNPSVAARFALPRSGGLASPRVSPGPPRSQTPSRGALGVPRNIQNSRMNTPEVSPVKVEINAQPFPLGTTGLNPDNRPVTSYPPSHPGFRGANYGAAPFSHARGGLQSGPQPGPQHNNGIPGGVQVGQNFTMGNQQGTNVGQQHQPNVSHIGAAFNVSNPQTTETPQLRRRPSTLRQDGKPLFYPYDVDQSVAPGGWRRDRPQSPVMNRDGVMVLPNNYHPSIISHVQVTMSNEGFPEYARQSTEQGLDLPSVIRRRYVQMLVWQMHAAHELAKAGVDALFVIQRKNLLRIEPKHSDEFKTLRLAIWAETPDGAFWLTEAGTRYDPGDNKLIDMKHFFDLNFPGIESLPSPETQIRTALLASQPSVNPTVLHAPSSNQTGQWVPQGSSIHGFQGGNMVQAAPAASVGYGTGLTGNPAGYGTGLAGNPTPYAGQHHGAQVSPQSSFDPTSHSVQLGFHGGQYMQHGLPGHHGSQVHVAHGAVPGLPDASGTSGHPGATGFSGGSGSSQ